MRRLPARLALSLAFSLSPLALAAGNDPVLVQADKLISEHQAAAAFDLLAPLEDTRAGDPDYDYLLGLAALDSGRAGIAAFAFERCLAMDPLNGPCRVQMARTHLALGENSSARQELQTVQDSRPPAEVQDLVSRYLGTVSEREQQEKRRISAHAQLGFGYDSNVSSTTADTQVAIPRLGGLTFQLNGIATRQEDSFAQVQAGAGIDQALSPAWRLQAEAGVATRRHEDVDVLDNQSADLSLGLSWRTGASSVVGKVQAQDYKLDGDAFRSLYGTMLQYQYGFSERAAVSTYAQASHLDFHVGGPDADRYTLGGGYSRALDLALSPAVYAGVYGGQEVSDTANAGIGQDFMGLRFGGSLGLRPGLSLTASLSLEERQFDGASTLFLVEREDTAIDLGLGAIYQLGKNLSLRPAYTWSSSDSNIVLSDYKRHVVTLDLRYDL
jgi:hypothetical protein